MVLNDNECGLILADNSDARVKLIQTTLDSNYLCLLTWTVTLRNTIKGRHISQVMYRKKMRREVLNSVTDRRTQETSFVLLKAEISFYRVKAYKVLSFELIADLCNASILQHSMGKQ